jgi:hypothetical protein
MLERSPADFDPNRFREQRQKFPRDGLVRQRRQREGLVHRATMDGVSSEMDPAKLGSVYAARRFLLDEAWTLPITNNWSSDQVKAPRD